MTETIDLGNNWKIETLGKEHIAGGFVHLISPTGEIEKRILSADFLSKPKETTLQLLAIIGYGKVNLASHEDEQAYEVSEGLFVGGSGEEIWISEQHPTERDINFENDAELIYYAIEEWIQNPEEVIGAFLMCLKQNIET